MRAIVAGLVLIGSVFIGTVALAAVAGAGEATHISATLRYAPGKISRHRHPPAGDQNDLFCSTLTLFNPDTGGFGNPARAKVGTMRFCYELNDAGCGDYAAPQLNCPTADIRTQTTLPGGLIYAGHRREPIKSSFTMTVTGGAGAYKGARGTISISAPAILKKGRSATLDITVP